MTHDFSSSLIAQPASNEIKAGVGEPYRLSRGFASGLPSSSRRWSSDIRVVGEKEAVDHVNISLFTQPMIDGRAIGISGTDLVDQDDSIN